MIVATVMYPPSARFDLDYYMQRHIPLVKARCEAGGLTDARVLKGAPGPDGAAPPFQVIALLTFASLEQFQATMQKHGGELIGDVPNFTDANPSIQVNMPVG